MSAFRTVFFRPRLAMEWKIPVLAIVKTHDGTSPIFAQVLPDAGCLGSAASHSLLKSGLAKLGTNFGTSWSELPVSIGPHFELGDPCALPDVADPHKWIMHSVLPDRQPTDGEEQIKHMRLKTVAWNLLETWGATRYVEKNLRPGRLNETQGVPDTVSITHYVPGRETVLLLEPVDLNRSPKDAIGKIFQKFSTYKLHWDKTGRKVETITYVLPGTDSRHYRDELIRGLKPVSDVLFTADQRGRHALTSRINDVGHTLDQLHA